MSIKGKKGPDQHIPTESPDTLVTLQYAKVLDIISEGEIEGLVNGLKSVYLDDIPVQNEDGSYNFNTVIMDERTGTQGQTPISGFYSAESVVDDGNVTIDTTSSQEIVINDTNADIVKVSIGVPYLYRINDDGDTVGTSVQLQIDVKPDSGSSYVAYPAGTTRTVYTPNVQTPNSTSVETTSVIPCKSASFNINWTRTQVGTAYWTETEPGDSDNADDFTLVPVEQPVFGGNYLKVNVYYKASGDPDWTFYEERLIESDPTDYFTEVVTFREIVNINTEDQYYFKVTVLEEGPIEYTNYIPCSGSAEWYSIYNPNCHEILEVGTSDMTIGLGDFYRYTPSLDINIGGKCTSIYRRDVFVEKPETAGNPWYIRVRRITADHDAGSNIYDPTVLASHTLIVDNKLSYPNTALIGLIADAKEFSAVPVRGYEVKLLKIQIPTNYDPIARTYTGSWDGTFTTAWSNNPAWCLYDILVNDRYGLGKFLTPNNATSLFKFVDKWKLYEIGKYCDEMVPDGFGGVEPRYTLNYYIQTQSEAYELLNSLASVFKGIIYWTGSYITADYDAPKAVSAIFNNTNVIDGMFNYSGSALKARHNTAAVVWNDPQDAYRQKIEYIEDQEDVINRGNIVQKDIVAVGCTSRGQARRVGRWMLYSERYENSLVSFNFGLDNMFVKPGDLIDVYDRYKAGQRFSGRIIDSTLTSITIDDTITIESGKTYTLAVLDTLPQEEDLGDGYDTRERAIPQILEFTLTNSVGDTNTLTFSNPQSKTFTINGIWAIYEDALTPQKFKVLSIADNNDGTFELTALEHNESKFNYIENLGNLVFKNTYVSNNLNNIVSNVTISENMYLSGPTVLNRLTVTWDVNTTLNNVFKFNVEIRQGDGNWEYAGTTNMGVTSFSIDNAYADNYTARIIVTDNLGRVSEPVYSTETTLYGKTSAPSDVDSLSVSEGSDGTRTFSWVHTNAEADIAGYIIRYYLGYTSDWNVMTDLNDRYITNTPFETARLSIGTYTFAIKAIDTSGNLSDNAAFANNITLFFDLPEPGATSNNNVFTEYFDKFSPTDDGWKWTNWNGSGDFSISNDAYTGNTALQIGNNSGNDMAWAIHDTNIVFNPNKLYRIIVVAKQTAGSGTFYAGFAGRNADDSAWVNATGADSISTSYYIAANFRTLTSGYQIFEGYFKGFGTPINDNVSPAVDNTEQNYSGVHSDLAYFRPLIIANYSLQSGITLIDSFIVEEINEIKNSGINILNKDYSILEGFVLPYMASYDRISTPILSSSAYIGTKSLSITCNDPGGDGYLYLSENSSTYNIKIQPNRRWIFSCWIYSNQTIGSQSIQSYIRVNSGTHISAYLENVNGGSIPSSTWTRVKAEFNLINFDNTTANLRLDVNDYNTTVLFDGLMLEEKLGSLYEPSAYSAPVGILNTEYPTGSNMIINSGLRGDSTTAYATYGWNTYTQNGDATYNYSLDMTNWTIKDGLAAQGTLRIFQNGTSTNLGEWYTDRIPVEAGKRYEAFCYAIVLRTTFKVQIIWYDSTGSQISVFDLSDVLNDMSGTVSDGKTLDKYEKVGLIATAPTGATTSRVAFIKYGTVTAPNSYAFLCLPYFGEVTATQQELSLWNEGPSFPGEDLLDVLNMINAPAEAGADVTGNNTSADTLNVDGVDSSLVRNSIGAPFRNGLETTEYDDLITGSYHTKSQDTDEFSGTYSALITTLATHAGNEYSSGATSGARFTIPEEIALQLAGKRIRVTIYAKQPSINASSQFAVAYSTADNGNSGWNYFTTTTSYQPYSFWYDVPLPVVGGEDYLGIWADTSNTAKSILIDNVAIDTNDAVFGSGVNVLNANYSIFEGQILPTMVTQNNATLALSGASYFGNNSLSIYNNSGSAEAYVYLGANDADFNISIEPNKYWIYSAYVRSNIANTDIDLFIKGSNGLHYAVRNLKTSSTANTWSRVYGVIEEGVIPAQTGVARLDINTPGATVLFDGLMLEELVSNISNQDLVKPSAYVIPKGTVSGEIAKGLYVPAGYMKRNTNELILDWDNRLIRIGTEAWKANGIQFEYNGGSPRGYMGDGNNKYFMYDGTDVEVGPESKILGVQSANLSSDVFFATNFGSVFDFDTVTTNRMQINSGSVGNTTIIHDGTSGSFVDIASPQSYASRTWEGRRRLKANFSIQHKLATTYGTGIFQIGTGNLYTPYVCIYIEVDTSRTTSYIRGVSIVNSVTYATAWSGSALSDDYKDYNIYIDYIPGTSVSFYYNGISLGTLTNVATPTYSESNPRIFNILSRNASTNPITQVIRLGNAYIWQEIV